MWYHISCLLRVIETSFSCFQHYFDSRGFVSKFESFQCEDVSLAFIDCHYIVKLFNHLNLLNSYIWQHTIDYEFWPQTLCVIHDQTMLVTYFTQVSIKTLKLCYCHMFQGLYLSGISFRDYILIFLCFNNFKLIIDNLKANHTLFLMGPYYILHCFIKLESCFSL